MTYARLNELKKFIDADKLNAFLETIESLRELDIVRQIVFKDFTEKFFVNDFKLCTEGIKKYSEVELSGVEDFPLAFERLNKPGGKIALHFFYELFPDIKPEQLLPLVEYILEQCEIGVLEIRPGPVFNEWTMQVLSYYTQYQVGRLRRFLFPNMVSSGGGGRGCYWIFKNPNEIERMSNDLGYEL